MEILLKKNGKTEEAWSGSIVQCFLTKDGRILVRIHHIEEEGEAVDIGCIPPINLQTIELEMSSIEAFRLGEEMRRQVERYTPDEQGRIIEPERTEDWDWKDALRQENNTPDKLGYFFEVEKRDGMVFAYIWRDGEDTTTHPPVKSFHSALDGDDGWRTVSNLASEWIKRNGRKNDET